MSRTGRRHPVASSYDQASSLGMSGWCGWAGKVIFRRKRAARHFVRWQRSQPDCYDGRLLNAYRCGNHWHVGHRSAA